MTKQVFTKYLNIEVLGGTALLIATIVAITLVNSPYKNYYDFIVNYPLGVSHGDFHFSKSILFWVNDGLISFFFLLIGFEIKRELLKGQLSGKGQLSLPLFAAISGMIVPAIIYSFFNYDNTVNMRGWAIPVAMDTAFALGILSLLGKGIPKSLRIFLVSLAIIDDILAVLVIVIFYANEISHLSALVSISVLAILMLLNQIGVNKGFPYLILGFILWVCVLQSGVHTSIAGVLLAFCIPLENKNDSKSLLVKMEEVLHPWVSFLILPVFAFTNAGVSFDAFSPEKLLNPLALGIILGLFVGKQIGVFGITWILVKIGNINLPNGVNWLQMYGASILCGIGFTMSFFIGALSFESGGPAYNDVIKSSVYIGSTLSAIFAVIIFNISFLKTRNNK
jgi:NhaA family Na+:H+ antiporter